MWLARQSTFADNKMCSCTCYKLFIMYSRKFFTPAENILLISPFYSNLLLLGSSLRLFSYFRHKYSTERDKGNLHTAEMLYNLLKWWIKLKLPVKAKWKAILFAIFIAAMEKQPNSWTACCLRFIDIHSNQRKCWMSKDTRMNCTLECTIPWQSHWFPEEELIPILFFDPQNWSKSSYQTIEITRNALEIWLSSHIESSSIMPSTNICETGILCS